MGEIKKAENINVQNDKKQRSRVSQTDIPNFTLEEALKVPKAIIDNFAGKPTAPLQIAVALDISPGSSNWRNLSGASIAYGLTNGGYNSKDIALADIGKRIVSPTKENDDNVAIVEAALTPKLLNKFYNNYNNAKFPKDNIAQNVLLEMGVPQDKLSRVLDIIKQNGEFAGLITNTKNGPFVFIDPNRNNENGKASQSSLNSSEEFEEDDADNDYQEDLPKELLERMDIRREDSKSESSLIRLPEKIKVFISHGKNKKMVEQLKELLIYGQFEPVVSIEGETTAIPVPEKVFNDMRKCNAGIIHIEGEQVLFDDKGNMFKKINENVLIEIGAAIALYNKKFILLCQKGVTLPSNLQGLYRCDYEGDQLDYNATMKLLKAFIEFRQ